jgi:glycyl-tRNA synthetase beta chain
MVKNQRYFPIFAADGKLLPGFIGVRNGTDESLAVVAAGNERVLRARLEDALFFWNEDLGESMDTLADGLSGVMFHEKLGSMRQKVERVKALAGFIGSRLSLSTPERLNRAASICKADLLSSMVYEFPELQGIMGRYYARHQSEDDEVAQAILEHYMPRYAGDQLPQTPTGTVLALAEKIDHMVGFFMIGAKPSGSQDPYALRRQALGVVHIMLDGKLTADLQELILFAYDNFTNVQPTASAQQVADDLIEFVNGRLKGVLQEKNYSYDVIDAVLASASGQIYEVAKKTGVITQSRKETWFEDFITVYNRSHNLTKKWQETEIEPSAFVDPAEESLWNTAQTQLALADNALQNGDHEEAMRALAVIRPGLDAFFNAVMVMTDDEKIKHNRLSLLRTIANRGNKIANFSLLVL